MLYAPSGSTEATAFGGTSSDVAVEENTEMCRAVLQVEAASSLRLRL